MAGRNRVEIRRREEKIGGKERRLEDGVLEREPCMFDARASVTRVSGANGARNPNNKGENMPHGQNVTSGLINSQDFRGHGLTHLPPAEFSFSIFQRATLRIFSRRNLNQR